jgi:hypothetical protein
MKLGPVIKKGLGDKKEIFKAQVKSNHQIPAYSTYPDDRRQDCSLFNDMCLDLNDYDHDLICLYYFPITPSIFSLE